MSCLCQRVFQRTYNQPPHHARVTETHLRFGWVHIHIHKIRCARHEKRHSRVAISTQKIGISPTQSSNQKFVSYRALVHKEKLCHSRTTRICRKSRVASQCNPLTFRIDCQRILGKITAHNLRQTSVQSFEKVACLSFNAKLNLRLAIARHIGQTKAHIRLGHCQPLHNLGYCLHFCAVRAHKFQTSRCRIENITQFNAGSACQSRWLHSAHISTRDLNTRAFFAQNPRDDTQPPDSTK